MYAPIACDFNILMCPYIKNPTSHYDTIRLQVFFNMQILLNVYLLISTI